MRISGGKWRGRNIRVPAGQVRPTQDMVRQALFSMLIERVAGAAFLDLFAGSGSVGLEAASRGAARVCWVETDRGIGRVLHANVADLCGTPEAPASDPCDCEASIVCSDVFRFLESSKCRAFDVVFADPPYERISDRGWVERLLAGIVPALNPGGICIIEHCFRDTVPETVGWVLLRHKIYGETALSFFERTAVQTASHDAGSNAMKQADEQEES